MESDIATNNNKISYPSTDSTKVGFISVTQAVNLDTMESDIATNNNKVSYPSADSTKVGFISVTQAVNLDTMESDIATNNNKISYPSADSTKVGFISVTQAVNLDTMESDIANKVSADGSINTHSDVNINTPADGHILTYDTGEWKNLPPAEVTGYLPLVGGTMTGPLKSEVSTPAGGWTSYFKYTGGTVNGRTYGFLLDANSFYLTAHNDDYSYSHPIMRFDHDGYCYAMKNFSAGTFKVVDVGTPTGPLDATNKLYVDNAVGGRLSLSGGTMSGNLDMGGYNINTVGTVDGYNLDTLNTNINNKLPLTGGTVTGNLTNTGFFTANAGSKLVVQNSINGGNSRGIFIWNSGDTNWGIYMAQSGSSKALNNGTAPAWNFSSYAIRFRVYNASDTGFIWERSDNNAIASLNCSGVFQSRGPYSNVSDRRQKENFGETFGLEFINKLKPLSFSMIYDDEKQVRHGLIAQDVEEVLAGYDLKFSGLQAVKVKTPNPDCKYKDEPTQCTMLETDEVEYTLAYSEFIAPLIKAVQELSAEVKALKAEVELLKNPII